ncbi:MAG: hypothetical protein ABI599_06765 [Flavobacteriales bacterium]
MKKIIGPLLLFACSLNMLAQDSVLYHWSGALSATQIRVHAQLNGPCDSVRLLADDDPQWGSPLFSQYMSADTVRDLVIPFRLTGLDPGTYYLYRFEVAGAVDTTAANTGYFRTPVHGAYSYSFTTGSCNGSGQHPVWQSMQWLQPLFFLSIGDLHYAEPSGAELSIHRAAYVTHVYTQHPMIDFLHRSPIAYVWDDHDYSGDASDRFAVGKASAARAYREHVPHYQLPNDTAVYQAYTIGRVRFILTDMHATKDSTHMMDSTQHAWLRSQLLMARDSGWVACWITSLSWNPINYPENWGSAPQEREDLSNWLLSNNIDDLFLICGDAHMLAIDDGDNCDFSTGQNSPYRYPVLQAAALNRGGSYKGGTFDQGGYFPNPTEAYGQFGEVLVDDDGADVCITLNGWRTDSLAPELTLIDSYTFCRTPDAIDSFSVALPSNVLHAWYADGVGISVDGIAVGTQAEIAVVDALGRTVLFTGKVHADATLTLSTQELRSASYIAIVRNGEQRAFLKFVVE